MEEQVRMKSLQVRAADVDVSQLSQTELESNKQQQEDEVVVLQSMYGPDFVSIDEGGTVPGAFMIHVHAEIPDIFKLSTKPAIQSVGVGSSGKPSNDDDDDDDDDDSVSNDDDDSVTIQALPPISLLCVYPPTYPSRFAPLFELSCPWLSSKRLSSLCSSLDAVWEGTSPEVVVYTWSQWLRSQALHHLGVFEKLELESDEQFAKSDLDKRAVSKSETFDVDISGVLRYNEDVKARKFLESVHTCCICFSDFSGFRFTSLPCQHHFCKRCMQQYCNVHVKDGTVMNLTCPDPSCEVFVPPPVIREVLDEESFERWEELILKKTLDSMPDVAYCPKCATASIENADHFVRCNKCWFTFCSLCQMSWYPGKHECITPEMRLRLLRARRKGKATVEETSKEEMALINECLDMDYIQKETKQCPTCKIAVEKRGGCNKMTCTNCGRRFCFQCGKSVLDYNHFVGFGACVLLPEPQINRGELPFELEFNLRLLWQMLRAVTLRAGRKAAGRACPNCDRVNYKRRGNNNILCLGCQNRYCGVCNTIVPKANSKDHYGLNKCEQRSRD